MISASLLPPPVPSHGTRSPAASLDSFPVLVQYLPTAIQSCSPHTGEAAWQPTAAAAAAAPLHRGMLLSLLVSLSVTVCYIQPKTPLPSSSLLFSSSASAAPGGGWRANKKGVCVVSSPLSSTATQREETPALHFRSRALPLAPCVSWPLALPPLPPSLSPLPSSLSISPPPPATTTQSGSRRMRARERGGRRAEIGCQGDHVTPGRGLRDPLPAVQLMLP